jgi:hypothetical protein
LAVQVDERLREAAVDVVSGLLGEGAPDGPDDGPRSAAQDTQR